MSGPTPIRSLYDLVIRLQEKEDPIYVSKTNSGYVPKSQLRFVMPEMTAHTTSTGSIILSPNDHSSTIDINDALTDIVMLSLYGILSLNPESDYDDVAIRTMRMDAIDGVEVRRTHTGLPKLTWTIQADSNTRYWSKATKTNMLKSTAHPLPLYKTNVPGKKVRVVVELRNIQVLDGRLCFKFVGKHVEVNDEPTDGDGTSEITKKSASE